MSKRYEIDYDKGAIIEWQTDGTRVHCYPPNPQWYDDHGNPVEHPTHDYQNTQEAR